MLRNTFFVTTALLVTPVLLVAALLTACTGSEEPASLPSSGIDLNGMDASVRPQDDFFAYVNGRWLSDTEIPADKTSWGTFDILRERTLEQLHRIVEQLPAEPTSHNAELVITLYRDILAAHSDAIHSLHALEPLLGRINELESHDQLPALFAELWRVGATTPIASWVGQDRRDSRRHVVYLSQAGLGLPDRDYYSDESERGQYLRSAYQHYLETLLELAGDGREKTARTTAILDLETRLAQHHWSRVDNRDAERTYNATTPQELLHTLTDDWQRYFDTLELTDQPRYIIRQPDYLANLQPLLAATPIPVWRDYLKIHLLRAYAPWLGSRFDEAYFDFYGRELGGAEQPEPLWKRALTSVNNHLGDALGQLYVERHFPPAARERMLTMVDNLRLAFADAITESAWMSQETQQRALEKLNALTVKIGYPNEWRDYSALQLQPGDLVGNLQRIRLWHHARDVALLDQPVDPEEWFMPVQTVNAYYSPTMNEIVFPAAILQPPFFDLAADDAVNYGAIGGVIGHEIGHAFDDQGSRYDADGNLNNWWTEQDRARFDALGQQLVRQFSEYEVLPGEFINGELTLGENIGDLGGLSMAIRAYRLALNGHEPLVLDGFTGEQRVFIGWAQAWRVKRRDEFVRSLLRTGPHSQPEFRVNGVIVNIDDFHQTFGTSPDDRLYKPAADRVRIW